MEALQGHGLVDRCLPTVEFYLPILLRIKPPNGLSLGT